ncbi:amidohydrolase family protein [Planococcus halocryophilus]|uniref:amidohydrolase family protein n=1 Tax=Planococcus halocryophilus TaxID=1215089 RepID=UPI001F0DAE71|nr:amidohydrolase family protein [Planococcus halocryophilus]MCH4826922.1 amidohydrolase family protein [Planococcus halocryophilus]
MKLFDAHLHIIDPRFPLVENQGFMPEAFTSKDYLKNIERLEVVGGAVVSGSFQAFDQSYLIDALQNLGRNFVGVTQLPYNTSDQRILELNQLGVRALRFNVNRGGSEDLSKLDYFSRRVFELVNWHTELYINSRDLPEIAEKVVQLPAVSIDHLGLSKEGFPTLLSLVEKGIKVKATGFGRIDFDAAEAIQAICSIDPHALMFGTDLPSTRAKVPFQHSDVTLIQDALEDRQAENVLYRNALKWYLK